jgi:hypothetical protein
LIVDWRPTRKQGILRGKALACASGFDPFGWIRRVDRKRWLPIVLLATALVAWAGLFAAGAYLNLGADRPQHDLRKPLIILGSMATFLTFWGAALWLRARRQ